MRDLGRGFVFLPEPVEEVIERQNKIRILSERIGLVEQFKPAPTAAAFLSILIAGVIDEDAPHRLSRGGEEMPTTVELLIPYQPKIRLVNQCSGVKCVSRNLRRHARGGELSQLVVDKRE